MLPGIGSIAGRGTRFISAAISDSFFHAYSGTSVTAHFTFAAAGTVSGSATGSAANNTSYTWKVAGEAADFEIRVEQTSGTALTGGTLDSWLSLSSDRTWSLFRFSDGTTNAVLSVQIRNALTQEVIDTATVRLRAENE